MFSQYKTQKYKTVARSESLLGGKWESHQMILEHIWPMFRQGENLFVAAAYFFFHHLTSP